MMNNPYRPGAPYGGYPGYPPHQGGMQQFGGHVPPASGQFISPTGQVATTPMLPMEQSFIENILRLNLGKMATLYMTYENNSEWNAKIFKGRLEAAGRDHIIISDPTTGMRYLLLMVNLDYITFTEELKYAYPYGQQPPLATR
ncbi:spore coat protein GerQ [Paenibacillus sp. LMG 31456]|uniref:Spore coat protein GerQ n=1 Tax=Paenibacillus foliorum TaxID=2654974 RepID=A0A972GIX9_9BACL|nr:spore coat protein GerQ [Paenibacillus foliorum]NOU91639.1 spore coat protein GerQ [Paenibacillus foliorum]